MSLVMGEVELREKLMASNEEFRRLAKEHQSYARELDHLSARSHLSEAERVQEITLKKKKLLLKDRMHSMVLQYRKEMEAES
jgi:uncharacterized protein YdcH (DUF465 family)